MNRDRQLAAGTTEQTLASEEADCLRHTHIMAHVAGTIGSSLLSIRHGSATSVSLALEPDS